MSNKNNFCCVYLPDYRLQLFISFTPAAAGSSFKHKQRIAVRAGLVVTSILAMAQVALAQTVDAEGTTGYRYFVTGTVADQPPAPPSPGLMLMGGSDWSPEAWQWFADRSGNGNIVILRASQDGADGEWVYNEIGGIASVQTLVFHDRIGAFDPLVADILAGADGVFIAGGDQSNYVRFWKGSPVQDALNAHVAAGRPLGGTSAGLAIMGGAGYGALAKEAVDSQTALADPLGPKVTLVRDFLELPFLEHVITDTHFSERDRLGRLIAFVAQSRATTDPEAIGIGVDEDSVLTIDADGTGRFYTLTDGQAWLVKPCGRPSFNEDGTLEWPEVALIGIGPDTVLDFNTMNVHKPAFRYAGRVENGELLGIPPPDRQRPATNTPRH